MTSTLPLTFPLSLKTQSILVSVISPSLLLLFQLCYSVYYYLYDMVSTVYDVIANTIYIIVITIRSLPPIHFFNRISYCECDITTCSVRLQGHNCFDSWEQWLCRGTHIYKQRVYECIFYGIIIAIILYIINVTIKLL